MQRSVLTYLFIAFFGLLAAGLILFGYLSLYDLPPVKVADLKQVPGGPQHFELNKPESITYFDLVDPEMAPDDRKEIVMKGYNIFQNTKENAPDNAGNTLTCNNCHFVGGNSFGGKNNGISLAGVTNTYPRFSKRAGKKINLAERIQNCFMRSMNGVAPEEDSEVTKALTAYLEWISTGVEKVDGKLSWLGLQVFESDHKPDPVHGAKVYADNCAACHQPNGEGSDGIPPLWGSNSFNDGAGMNQIRRLSAFVYWNMPYQEPVLSKEEALDVAAYVTQKKRPHFQK